jgi:hypothetical protein
VPKIGSSTGAISLSKNEPEKDLKKTEKPHTLQQPVQIKPSGWLGWNSLTGNQPQLSLTAGLQVKKEQKVQE